MKNFLLLLGLLFQCVFFSLLWGKDTMVYSTQTCMSAQNENNKIGFSSDEVTKIVNTTGLDQRSICSFIELGSRVYPLDVLKEELFDNLGDLKSFLNQHYIFPEDSQFFQGVEKFIFSDKLSDSQQVLNSLILSDLLYGYTIGDTIPVYMQQFLYYAGTNKNKKEQEAMNRIMPYLIYLEGTLLKKKNFTTEDTSKYIKHIQRTAGQRATSLSKKSNSSSSVLQDSAY